MLTRNTIVIVMLGVVCFGASDSLALEFSQKLDVQVRYDDRSNRPSREQYRIRYYPALSLTDNWSINSFLVTGEDFSSSHNTFGRDGSDHFYPRRLYLRHQAHYGKTELGIIPTYKGRVSSTGLSKDGWIKGLRHVRNLQNNSALEVVVGQLKDDRADSSLTLGGESPYIEVEYSAKMGQRHSYELSAERMLEASFFRSEYRYRFSEKDTVFIEMVQRVDASASKWVVGTSGEMSVANKHFTYPVEYFVYYAYIDEAFGPRAQLIEDFIGTGHSGSAEFSGLISQRHNVEWFVRSDVVDSVSRIMVGVKFSFSSQ